MVEKLDACSIGRRSQAAKDEDPSPKRFAQPSHRSVSQSEQSKIRRLNYVKSSRCGAVSTPAGHERQDLEVSGRDIIAPGGLPLYFIRYSVVACSSGPCARWNPAQAAIARWSVPGGE